METKIQLKVYESPETWELNVAPEGMLCVSSPEISKFEREADAWEW